MTVSVGGLIDDGDYNGLVDRLLNILGDDGYGQRLDVTLGANTFPNVSKVTNNSTQQVSSTEWNNLRTQINRCSQHQIGSNQNIGTMVSTNIIGAESSGTAVTRVDTAGVITWTQTGAVANKGVNDYYTAMSNLETNYTVIDSGNYTLTTTRAFANSQRTASWGGAGQIASVDCQFDITFQGGYTVTKADGTTKTATGADHRRHFFNAGGEIRISGSNVSSEIKGSDWGTMLGNMGFIVIKKNQTICTGTGRARDGSTDVDLDGTVESAFGNNQLSTGLQMIFQRNGGDVDTDYAENTITVYAKRNTTGDIITIYVQLTDADTGDKTGTGPAVDEPVTGTLRIGLDLLRPSGDYVTIPEPAPEVTNELFQ